MKDLVKFNPNERVDIGDFNAVAVNSSSDQVNELIHNFLVNPDSDFDRFVLSGFGMSNPSGTQVRVEQGRAIVHQRLDGEIVESVLSTSGDTYKTVDMATYPAGTYYIYIRFEHVLGERQGRIFWNPSGTGSEYTQTVPTRYEPNWSVRIETSSPGQEWFKIGAVITPGMTITDLRNSYFEGHAALSYQSGWSDDGGGNTTDRNSDRNTYGIVDLHTFVAATKQCIEDIKGRGLRHWYEQGIGGINIGFDTDPSERCLYVQSTEFGLTASSTGAYRTLKFTDTTYWRYSTSSSNLSFRFDNTERITIDSSTIDVTQGVYIAGNGGIALNVQGSGTYAAIQAVSETGYNATAIRGTASGVGAGIQGISSDTMGSYGVRAQGIANVALYAQSSGSYPALEAHGGGTHTEVSDHDESHGIISYGTGSGGFGVYGIGGGTGASVGVKGLASNNGGYGVIGESEHITGAGVWALNTGAGSGLICANTGTGAPMTLNPLSANPSTALEGSIWFVSSGGSHYFRCFIGGSIRTIASW